MNSITNISILSILMMSLISCGNDDTITDYRGQVKFETISVSSKLAARISEIYVEEGQTVKKGDTLAYMDIPEVNAKMMQAEGAITSAKGQLNMAYNGATADQLNQIDGQIDAGKAQLNFAQESYNRLQAMYKDSLVSLQQFDEVKMKLEMAKAQVASLNAKRKEVNNSARVEQIDQAKGQLDRAVGAKEEVLSAANEKFLIAPTDMTIETISLQEGELLTPGFTLFNGYQKSSLYFRFTVPESKIYDFKVGEKITLVNPFTDQETEGEIATIKQLANYADITSTAPLYQLSESIYELKVVPTSNGADQSFFLNATILIKK
ncbi:HlyD family secretion protein [Gillisia hiemivivida]|jgi:HlyD family secretion protein|uniref:Biotin/lipoyl-binding protein n=1 Tax=Gillisia hiemivivida TaxID=291190 RepID=A0A5C6ZR85_9FLAO|nr:biotin/lipoyl-binding protein [Gillisia hiemivivida]TXD92125.1 biotin/lipoyl-binding protein [Gillisia hiemivivida]